MPDHLLTVTRDIEAAPGVGWRYTVPETGVQLTGKWAKQLRQEVVRHMEANGVPVPEDFETVFNDAACRESGLGSPYCGRKRPDTRPEGEIVNLNFGHVAKFLRAVKYALAERKFVSREEAKRRVAICMECPLVTDVGDCASCYQVGKLYKFALWVTSKLVAQPPKGKRHCGACGCVCSIKATLPLPLLRKVDDKEEVKPAYSETCWIRD